MEALEARVERLTQDALWFRAMLRHTLGELAAARRAVYRRLLRPVAQNRRHPLHTGEY